MNLQQTLKQTDLPRLAACAAHRHVASQTGRETVETFLRSLCALEPVRSDEKKILIPGSWYEAGEKHLTADLYRAADLETARTAWLPERSYSREELEAMDPAAREKLFMSLSQDSPQSLDYTAAPWAETLAAEVRMPESFSEEDRLDFLAAAVLEMAYFGFSPDDRARNMEPMKKPVQVPDTSKDDAFWNHNGSRKRTVMEPDPDGWVDDILQLQDTASMLQMFF